jgi:hypothetical protein
MPAVMTTCSGGAAVERQPGAEQQSRVVAPASEVADRPRLVDHELSAQPALPRRSAQRRRHREADRQVAGVQEHRRGDRRRERPAGREHRGRGELRRPGERRGREHDGGDGPEPGVARQHAEGQPERRDGHRERCGETSAVTNPG